MSILTASMPAAWSGPISSKNTSIVAVSFPALPHTTFFES